MPNLEREFMSDIFVLGINASHDISCAILKNGELVCAIAEERLNRIKRFTGGIDRDGMTNKHLPYRAIEYCLDAAKVRPEDVALIVVSTCVVANYQDYRTRALAKEEILEQLPKTVDPQKVRVIGHHIGHAASVFYPSGFADAAILIVDGGGSLVERRDEQSGKVGLYEERVTIYRGHGDEIDLKKQYFDGAASDGYLASRKHCSLGDLYQSATVFAGFKEGDEGKTMGLAPYGSEAYFDAFRQAVDFHNGSLSISQDFQFNKLKGMSKNAYAGRFGSPRFAGEPLRQTDKDVAAAVQYITEETLIGLAREAYEITKSENICLAGGVALNSVANKKILDRTPFKNIFIQPAAGDDGCALGNALWGWTAILGKPHSWRMKTAYTGRNYSREEINKAVKKFKGWCYPVECKNILGQTAHLLAEKKIVGWFQGGSESGPRALGHRSILSDTRFPEMKDILNKKVKHREGFRPFAPSILAEFNSEYFELDCPSPFMLLIAKVKKPDVIPAITHVDQTARVQTVTKEDNGIYYDLIHAYYKQTGVPVILNTSFNVAGEPIVETPEDAIRCFLSTKIDYLVLEDVLLAKKDLKCLVFKIWPQEIKRLLKRRLKQWASHYPFLRVVKRKLDRFSKKSQGLYAKVPG